MSGAVGPDVRDATLEHLAVPMLNEAKKAAMV
jgi:hypothetical protein